MPAIAEPVLRRWTREEFHRMADIGFFQGQRAELIEGEIMVLSPQKADHWTTTDRVADCLRQAFGTGFHVRMQGPLELGPHSEPEPDIAVVAGKREDFVKQHPRTALLVVEVSDSTLFSDRTRKASLYARAGIAEYWIVNLVDDQVEVRRGPRTDPAQIYGHGYQDLTILSRSDSVWPLALPNVAIPVGEFFP